MEAAGVSLPVIEAHCDSSGDIACGARDPARREHGVRRTWEIDPHVEPPSARTPRESDEAEARGKLGRYAPRIEEAITHTAVFVVDFAQVLHFRSKL